MTGQEQATGGDVEQKVRDRAYRLWEREGRPEGRSAEFWQLAEEQIRAEAGGRATAGELPAAETSGDGHA